MCFTFYKPLAVTALMCSLAFSATTTQAQRGGDGGPRNNNAPRNGGQNQRVENRQPVKRQPQAAPMRGQRYAAITGPNVSINFRGVPYQYSNGYYYRPYGNYYRVVAPPPGIRINVLPTGFISLHVGINPFFFFDGVFYRQTVITNTAGAQENNYEVIDAPVGAQVPSLPDGTKDVVINGNRYYELDGTYYAEIINNNGETWYEVAGKNGELNTPDAAPEPQVGDKYEQLPETCKIVVLNGRKYYVSSINNYYQEVIEGNKLYYQLVAKAGEGQL
ncbi:ATP-dependent RNA helicase A [Filimonas lacunae]|nr:ATP-dependent RNA helicase A [Filimonas lacunae]